MSISRYLPVYCIVSDCRVSCTWPSPSCGSKVLLQLLLFPSSHLTNQSLFDQERRKAKNGPKKGAKPDPPNMTSQTQVYTTGAAIVPPMNSLTVRPAEIFAMNIPDILDN